MRRPETIFFRVLADINEYLHSLTLVGGWVPYIYARYLWKDTAVMPLATSDIDFGIGVSGETLPGKTVYETLSRSYGQHHVSMDKPYPIVFHLENVEIHFIADEKIPREVRERLTGREVDVSEVEYFSVLVENRIPVSIQDHNSRDRAIYVPKPPAYVYHKGLTFVDRVSQEGKAKDLHYVYYVLRFCPDPNEILTGLAEFKPHVSFGTFISNMSKYFQRVSSEGCLMVEKENGPDHYVTDVRADAFNRFRHLITHLR